MFSKRVRRLSDTPRHIKLAQTAAGIGPCCEPFERPGFRVKHVNESMSLPLFVSGEHDEDGTVNHLNIERGITRGCVWLNELLDQAARGGAAKSVQRAFGEIGREQHGSARSWHNRYSGVDRPGPSRECFRSRPQAPAPSGDDAVEAAEDENIAVKTTLIIRNHTSGPASGAAKARDCHFQSLLGDDFTRIGGHGIKR